MRRIDPLLQARLDGGATTLCRCWRVTRKDGVVMGFTDHDRPLAFGGTEFRAGTGLDASALQTGNGLSVDNAQAVGALADEGISEEDLRAGRYDGAQVDHWLVDWRDPELRVHLFRGSIGEIRRTETSFEAELRGLGDALNVAVGRSITPFCDRVVGDRKCGVDLDDPRYRHVTAVAAVEGPARIVLAEAGDFPTSWFAGGNLSWESGRNAGLSGSVRQDLLADGRRVLALAAEPPFVPGPGDRIAVTAGCDRRAETCREKFGNFLNFRGFPHVPGEDWVVAYPRSGKVHDGSSRVR